MLLEAILYFVLGFLSAALLALMITPAIWNRAVALTKERIESSVPLSLNQIQADKDQLRAEFAMSTRRLEMSVEALRSKASEQMIDINRKRDELNRLTFESNEKLCELQFLESKFSSVSERLQEREARLTSLSDNHDRLQEEHDALLSEAVKLREQYSEAQTEIRSREVELSANNATIEVLRNTVTSVDLSEGKQLAKLAELEEQVAKQNSQLEEEKQKTSEAIERAKKAERDVKDLSKQINKKTKDITTYRKSGSDSENTVSKLTSELIDEKAKIIELEAKLAQQALQTEALLNDASNENVQIALRQLNEELDAKSGDIQSLRQERDQLTAELDAIKATAGENWADERQENAVLRQRINDLAAEVAVMVSRLEGEGSKIKQMLDTTDEDEHPGSLANRIRAIQKEASA